GEVTRDPRAWRCVKAAARAGLEVSVGCVADAPAVDQRSDVTVVRVPTGALTSAYRRGRGRSGRTEGRAASELRGAFRLARMVRTNLRLYTATRRFAPDVVHAHDLDALLAGRLVARRAKARLVYDAHELYTDQDPQTSWLERRGT